MARIRYIKPEFYSDTEISNLSIFARYLYIGLFCHFDKQGIFLNDPKLIKREIFPYDEEINISKIKSLLEELIFLKRLMSFEFQGKDYLFCKTFARHQNFHPGEKLKYEIPKSLLNQLVSVTSCKPVANQLQVSVQTPTCTTGTGTGTGIGTGRFLKGDSPNPPQDQSSFELQFAQETKMPSDPSSPDTSSPVPKLIGAYVKAYQKRYETRPVIDGKTQGQMKNLLKTIPLDRACELIQVFCQLEQNKWFNTKMHDFTTFMNNLNVVAYACDKGIQPGGTDFDLVWEMIQKEKAEDAKKLKGRQP